MTLDNLSFLVAEDHDFQRNILVRMLQCVGAKTIHQATDGHSALKVLKDPACSVDIVISDLEMPGMDGMEFIRNLGENGARVSIILASALESKLLASIETMSEAYGINLLGVIEKPLTPGKLMPLIMRHKSAKVESVRPVGPTFMLEEITAGLRSNEFEAFFQPKVDMATGQVKGAEALARWRHPQHGIVAPYAFIQTLEDNGKIEELSAVMVREAVAFCATWRDAGVEGTVSINLSVKSLGDVRLADRLTKFVRAQSLDPRYVIMEVTESAVATDLGHTLENLARLRMKGFGLSIDDYGTGYSSMQQLSRIAFTELKIDQSFVANATTKKSARVMLESSIDMARNLNITAVAEGVETQADWDLLRQLGCEAAQGYLIARPMESGAYMDWVRDWKLSQ